MHPLKIFTGNANKPLAEEICRNLRMGIGKASVDRFPDGEINIKLLENVRGCDAFIIQPTCAPTNDNLVELLLLIDALRRASATRITAVLPFYGYGRADRKAEPRVPISAKLVANLITAAHADRVLTVDLHAGQIQGFFDIPVDHLYANPVFIDYYKKHRIPDLAVVSPDPGAVERARAFGKRLRAGIAIIDKRRISPMDAEMYNVIGDVRGKNCLITDDIVDTAGTLCKAAEALVKKGAKGVYAACTHGILAGPAFERLQASPIRELVITNTIPIGSDGKKFRRLQVLSIAGLVAAAIRRIHEEKTLSQLFI